MNRPEQFSLRNATAAAIPVEDGNVMIASGEFFTPTINYNDVFLYIVCTSCFQNFKPWGGPETSTIHR